LYILENNLHLKFITIFCHKINPLKLNFWSNFRGSVHQGSFSVVMGLFDGDCDKVYRKKQICPIYR